MPRVMVYACNLSVTELEAGQENICSHLGLHNKTVSKKNKQNGEMGDGIDTE